MITNSARINKPEFTREIFLRINKFFIDNNISKRADGIMIAKIIAGILWWAGSYLSLFLFKPDFWQFLLIYVLHGLAQVFIFLNISHDANHHSISNNPLINKALSYSLDICGISSYMWRILHHRGHHSSMNIHGQDDAILSHGIFRMSPNAPWKKIYKYQHLYAFLIYGIVSLDFILFKDFESFYFSGYQLVKDKKHPLKEHIILFASKIFYLGYMILVPIFILNINIWLVLSAFFITHFIMGFIITLVIQSTHVIETSQFPRSTDEFDHHVYHIFATTADYSTANSMANWFLGGLHHHIIHHLCPNICHTHYPRLTGIVKDTAQEFGVQYRENRTMYLSLIKHFSLLKRLGDHA